MMRLDISRKLCSQMLANIFLQLIISPYNNMNQMIIYQKIFKIIMKYKSIHLLKKYKILNLQNASGSTFQNQIILNNKNINKKIFKN